MPIPTPFHAKTSALTASHEWSNWSGFLAAVMYEPYHEHEYYSIRNSAGLLDVSPLYKYEIKGPDAVFHADRIMTRDITKCEIGQIMYTPWCDEDGKVIDDGNIARLGKDHFRITAADPNLRWFQDCGYGLESEVVNVSDELAALALQGPNSRKILKEIVVGADLDKLQYFWLTEAKIDDFPITITRTGYTGDLGYELWVHPKQAERLWDIIFETGTNYGLSPFGLAALDMARIEAGLVLIEVDYNSSHKAVIESQKSSPYEIGLGWAVKFGENKFIGRRALEEEKVQEPEWTFIGLEIDWVDLESLFSRKNLPPQVTGRASRAALPIYLQSDHIGQATSITFSPLLKKYIALGSVRTNAAKIGTPVKLEVTVEYTRQAVDAVIVKPKFFNPKRKRSLGTDE
ncbi:MAG: aminomethyl transferase family protein [Chloroflexi bacterium]|nr:aminomethyl transferase family protein [Chloroflexota bacterium]